MYFGVLLYQTTSLRGPARGTIVLRIENDAGIFQVGRDKNIYNFTNCTATVTVTVTVTVLPDLTDTRENSHILLYP